MTLSTKWFTETFIHEFLSLCPCSVKSCSLAMEVCAEQHSPSGPLLHAEEEDEDLHASVAEPVLLQGSQEAQSPENLTQQIQEPPEDFQKKHLAGKTPKRRTRNIFARLFSARTAVVRPAGATLSQDEDKLPEKHQEGRREGGCLAHLCQQIRKGRNR